MEEKKLLFSLSENLWSLEESINVMAATDAAGVIMYKTGLLAGIHHKELDKHPMALAHR